MYGWICPLTVIASQQDETLAGEQFLVSPGLVSGRQQPLLELPQVHSVQQAQHVVQTLQQQLFLELRRLQGQEQLPS